EFVGDDPEVLLRAQRQEPLHGLLDHGLFAVQGEHLLGQPAAAPRPETGPASARQDHRIERLFAHGSLPPTNLISRIPRSLPARPSRDARSVPWAATRKETPAPVAAAGGVSPPRPEPPPPRRSRRLPEPSLPFQSGPSRASPPGTRRCAARSGDGGTP